MQKHLLEAGYSCRRAVLGPLRCIFVGTRFSKIFHDFPRSPATIGDPHPMWVEAIRSSRTVYLGGWMFEPADVAAIGQGPGRPTVVNSQKWLVWEHLFAGSPPSLKMLEVKGMVGFQMRLSLNLKSKLNSTWKIKLTTSGVYRGPTHAKLIGIGPHTDCWMLLSCHASEPLPMKPSWLNHFLGFAFLGHVPIIVSLIMSLYVSCPESVSYYCTILSNSLTCVPRSKTLCFLQKTALSRPFAQGLGKSVPWPNSSKRRTSLRIGAPRCGTPRETPVSSGVIRCPFVPKASD